jgi:uncharacterized protein
MNQPYPLKIDAYSHIAPKRFRDRLAKIAPKECAYAIDAIPAVWDLDRRFKMMDRYQGLVQVIAPSRPALESAAPGKAIDLAKVANDEIARLVADYPERFPAGVACLPLNNIKAASKEIDRAIKELRLRGVLIYSPINDKPLDLPEFEPLYEKMAKYDLPILIHPMRNPDYPDYRTEKESKYRLYNMLGWPYETMAAMTRLAFSGIFERYPNLKFITHHCGGGIPFYAERIKQFQEIAEFKRGISYFQNLTKAPLDYYRMFYADTAIYGNAPALMCGHAFFGADRLLFGVDFPLGDLENGTRNYRQTINAIEEMNISAEDKKKIYEDNARKIYRLPI